MQIRATTLTYESNYNSGNSDSYNTTDITTITDSNLIELGDGNSSVSSNVLSSSVSGNSVTLALAGSTGNADADSAAEGEEASSTTTAGVTGGPSTLTSDASMSLTDSFVSNIGTTGVAISSGANSSQNVAISVSGTINSTDGGTLLP